MDVIMEFATPIGMFYTEDTELTTDIFSKVLEIANEDMEDVQSHINQCTTTPDDLHTRECYASLVSFIEQKTERFSEEILGIKKDDIELNSMWSNIHNVGSKHHTHQHPNAFLSGAFYPYIPECKEPGNILFIDPRQAKNMVYADFVKSSCISNRRIWVTPKTGLLLLFPSWLEHGTDPFIGSPDQKRVSISFNYLLRSCTHKTMRI